LLSINDVLNEPSPEWRVEGLLPVGALSMIYAPQGQFKTFFALDLALSVALGTDFHGHTVKQGPTVYVLGEGRGGLKNRVRAWMREHGAERVEDAFFVLEAVQFSQPGDVQLLKGRINSLNVKPAMLFIDTFARSAVGLDENDAMQVGLWINAVTNLQHDMEVDVVALHHAQKAPNDDRKGMSVRERGSSAFIGAVDTVIRLSKDRHEVKATCEKQKDAEEFAPFALGIRVVPLSINEHGDSSSSCVLVDQESADISPNHLAADSRIMLETLLDFPQSTAGRGAWMPKTGFAERTFDRRRDDLLAGDLIQATEGRGVYRITDKGLLAIATELSTDRHDNLNEVAATVPPLGGGETATTVAAPVNVRGVAAAPEEDEVLAGLRVITMRKDGNVP
jgi:hypothetical protein